MGLIPALNEPTTGDPRVPAPLVENDTAIRTVVNGNIDNTNLAAGAALANLASGSVTDAKLASPNNSVYRTLMRGAGIAADDLAAGTYLLGPTTSAASVGSAPSLLASATAVNTELESGSAIGRLSLFTDYIYFDDADYTVGSLTQKLRLRAQVNCNATSWSSVTATFGLHPVTFAGGTDTLTPTIGAAIVGSTVAVANPTNAANPNQGNSGDFAIPADGFYCIGVVTSATLTNAAAALLTAQLQTRNTA